MTLSGPQQYEDWFAKPFGRRYDAVERRMLTALLGQFDSPASLLDAGCGTGHFMDLWSWKGLRVAGVDASRPRAQYAHEHHPDTPLALADARNLPFPDASFDIVAIMNMLEFVEPPQRVIKEAARVARQGLLLVVLNSLSLIAAWRRVTRSRSYRGAHFYSPWGLERLVRLSLGDRPARIVKRTGLQPVRDLGGIEALPFGALVGMAVRFR